MDGTADGKTEADDRISQLMSPELIEGDGWKVEEVVDSSVSGAVIQKKKHQC